jgi:hypothetical protein
MKSMGAILTQSLNGKERPSYISFILFLFSSSHPSFPSITMSNTITLICLVHGDRVRRAFPVDVDKSKTIGHLKKLIKQELPNSFCDVDAKELALWKVSIPSKDGDALRDFYADEDEELDPTRKISKYFTTDPDDEHIHVIIERPPTTDGIFLFCFHPSFLFSNIQFIYHIDDSAITTISKQVESLSLASSFSSSSSSSSSSSFPSSLIPSSARTLSCESEGFFCVFFPLNQRVVN